MILQFSNLYKVRGLRSPLKKAFQIKESLVKKEDIGRDVGVGESQGEYVHGPGDAYASRGDTRSVVDGDEGVLSP